MKVKEESEKVALKLNIQKTKILASGPITSWQIFGETIGTVTDFIFFGSRITVLLLLRRFSRVRLCATPQIAAYQAPPSLGFSRQEHWSGLPFPSPGDLPDPRIKPRSPALQADALPSEPPGKLRNH